MSGWVAGAIVGASAYSAYEARKARKQAVAAQTDLLAKQSSDAAALRDVLAKNADAAALTAAGITDQAKTAREALQRSQAQYQENKLAMEQKAKEVQAAADEERRKAAQSEASALRARTRGGKRSLLSQERLTPELGVMGTQLGTGGMLQ